MTEIQRETVRNSLLQNYTVIGKYYSIGEALFHLQQMYGISLLKAKEIFIDVATKHGWYLVRTSTAVVTSLSVEGKRGDSRILKWFLKMPSGFYHSHFILRGK